MKYDELATQDSVTKTIEMLATHNVSAELVQTGKEALDKIKTLIPAGASIMNGSSVTLEQIGFVELLKTGNHQWNNVHAVIIAEQDKVKQAQLRKHALSSDYYLGSVHAMSESGEFIVASNTGSQLPHIVYSSQNLIFVVGAQKIVPSLAEAFKRLEEYVVPLEDKHMQEKYGVGTAISKIVVFKQENKMTGRNVHVILVNEKIGF